MGVPVSPRLWSFMHQGDEKVGARRRPAVESTCVPLDQGAGRLDFTGYLLLVNTSIVHRYHEFTGEFRGRWCAAQRRGLPGTAIVRVVQIYNNILYGVL